VPLAVPLAGVVVVLVLVLVELGELECAGGAAVVAGPPLFEHAPTASASAAAKPTASGRAM